MFDRILNMFITVSNESHGSLAVVFLIGIVFGAIIQYSRVDKFEKIAGFAMLRDTVVPKMLFLALGIASIGLYFLVQAGYATYHQKPIILGGLIVGGILFGISMAILGKSPGTGRVSIAEGRIDVLVGAIGGTFGGLFLHFTLILSKRLWVRVWVKQHSFLFLRASKLNSNCFWNFSSCCKYYDPTS